MPLVWCGLCCWKWWRLTSILWGVETSSCIDYQPLLFRSSFMEFPLCSFVPLVLFHIVGQPFFQGLQHLLNIPVAPWCHVSGWGWPKVKWTTIRRTLPDGFLLTSRTEPLLDDHLGPCWIVWSMFGLNLVQIFRSTPRPKQNKCNVHPPASCTSTYPEICQGALM